MAEKNTNIPPTISVALASLYVMLFTIFVSWRIFESVPELVTALANPGLENKVGPLTTAMLCLLISVLYVLGNGGRVESKRNKWLGVAYCVSTEHSIMRNACLDVMKYFVIASGALHVSMIMLPVEPIYTCVCLLICCLISRCPAATVCKVDKSSLMVYLVDATWTIMFIASALCAVVFGIVSLMETFG